MRVFRSARNFIKMRFQHSCFLVNIEKIFRTTFWKNICERLLLKVAFMWEKEILISSASNFKQSERKISITVSFSRTYQLLLSILKLWLSKFHLFLQRKFHFPRILSHPNSLMMNNKEARTRPWFVRVYKQSTF